MPALREVVITGLGVVCPIGIGKDSFWAALEAGQSGIQRLPDFAASNLPFRFGGLIKDFDAKQFVQPRKTIKVMCSEIQAGYAAAMLAMQDAGLEKGAVEPERLGVVLGSEMLYGETNEILDVFQHCIEEGEFKFELWAQHAFKDLYPLWMLKYLPNMAACHISIAHDARGPNNSIVEGSVSSLLAVMEATMAIQRGHADVMIVGGSGSAVAASCMPFRGWGHLSKWHGDATQASRPFESQRAGIVPGEGAGAMILESSDHAERRGADVLARVLGFASRFEQTSRLQPPVGRAIRQSIAAALDAAGLKREDIGHVNAHGLSAVEHDRVEAQAIRDTVGDTPVTALKSYFGDLSAGSGAVEMAASVLAIVRGRVPRTLNYDKPDPACPVNVIRDEPLPIEKRAALVLNQATTGQAAAVVISGP